MLIEIAEEIERLGHNANVTDRHSEYYSGRAIRNKDAEDLAKYVQQHLGGIVDALRMMARADVEEMARDVVVAVSELPDRTSPDDWPEAMLVTASELHLIVRTKLGGPHA